MVACPAGLNEEMMAVPRPSRLLRKSVTLEIQVGTLSRGDCEPITNGPVKLMPWEYGLP